EDRERQSDILRALATLLPNFLSRGALVAATSVLQEVRAMAARPGVFDDRRRTEAVALLDQVSAPETIDELIRALYDGTIRATPSQLGGFLSYLHGRALAPLLRASERVEHKELRAVLRQAVGGIAQANRREVLRLLGEKDPVVASGAARLAGAMQLAEAGTVLAELLRHEDATVRLAAIEAAVSLKASTVAGALEHAMEDPDREVRIAA